ncbi:Transmembrane protease serine 9 [Cichlidogyrus casuarinus]|uniref:Transmembrane protease serine 9 n=1 Tax=Cichlidogyrus casuarinus TaxID=1844966 RepID=A0ABD2PLZ4_9PLAT
MLAYFECYKRDDGFRVLRAMKSLVLRIISVVLLVNGRALDDIDKRVINGETLTDLSKVPSAVRISDYKYLGAGTCGGTLIDDDWVLTAAHCLEDLQTIYIQAGSAKTSDDPRDDPLEDLKIFLAKASRWFKHKQCKQIIFHHLLTFLDVKRTFENDIALIKLERPVNFEKYPHIKKAPLATNKTFPGVGVVCKMAGWGRMKDGETAIDAQFLQTNVFDPTLCSKKYKKYSFNPKKQFCDLHKTLNKSTAEGDSGSGFLCHNGSTWLLAGLVSYGDNRDYFTPSVNVRVSAYHDWIKETMTKDNPAPKPVDNVILNCIVKVIKWILDHLNCNIIE